MVKWMGTPPPDAAGSDGLARERTRALPAPDRQVREFSD